MSKTGGGQGTNQHKAEGVGVSTEDGAEHAKPESALDIFQTQFGATPIDLDAAQFLTPEYSDLETLDELNEAEVLNIAEAGLWLEEQDLAPEDVLNQSFLRGLHRRMFCEVWTWAGQLRQRETNLGIDPLQIQERWQALLGDVLYWIENRTYPVPEICVRLHHRMVAIHPFTNGNGRHARITANTLAVALGQPDGMFTWGRKGGITNEAGRVKYLAALRTADQGSYDDLVEIARS